MTARVPDHAALPESEVDRLLTEDRQTVCYCGAKTRAECDAILAAEIRFLEGHETTLESITTKQEKHT